MILNTPHKVTPHKIFDAHLSKMYVFMSLGLAVGTE